MNLESEVATHDYVEDNETIKQADDRKVGDNHVGGSKIKDIGTFFTNNDTLDAQLNVNTSTPPLGNHQITSEDVEAVSPQQPADTSLPRQSPQSTKGYGLKKWKRVNRDFVRDNVLKPESSSSISTPKAVHFYGGGIKRSDGSYVQPFNLMKNVGVSGASTMQESSSDSRFGNGVAVAAVLDFEKSEDRSSESSTAASVPRVKYDVPAGLEHVWDKKWPKNSGGKSIDSAQKAQGGQLESSKRPRGERVKVMEENSLSSMESDSRSSNFIFSQGAFSFTENEDQIKASMKYVADNNNKAHSSEGHDQEDQTVNEEEVAGEIGENDSPTSQDPFVESILALQSVEKALETELHKLREMGKEAASLLVDSNLDSSSPVESTSEAGIHEPSSSDQQLDPERINRNTLSCLETQVSTLTEYVNYLDSKLKESMALLEKKESRITELEAAIIDGNQLEGQPHVTVPQQDRLLDMEPELENLFRLKIEAEVEYLALIRTVKKLREDVREGIKLFREQSSLVGEQSVALNKLREIGNKADVDLETCTGDVLGMEEVLKLQKRVCGVSYYFSIQLILLILVFWLVASQLSPHPVMDVPT